MEAWEGGRVVAADPWPLSCSLKHGGFSQRKKMLSSSIRASPHREHGSVNTLDRSEKATLTCLHKPSLVFNPNNDGTDTLSKGKLLQSIGVRLLWGRALWSPRTSAWDCQTWCLMSLGYCCSVSHLVWLLGLNFVSVYLTLYIVHAHLLF